MKTYTYSEARQRLATLLDQAHRDGQVTLVRQDASTFVLQPVAPTTSPLDVPAVRSSLRAGERVDLVRHERERAGRAVLQALPRSRRRPTKAPSTVRGSRTRKKQLPQSAL